MAWVPWTASHPAAAEAAIAALAHPSAGVRRNAVQVLPRDARSRPGDRRGRAACTTPMPRCGWRPSSAWPISPPSDEAAEAVVAALRGGAGRKRRVAAGRGHGRRGQQRRGVLESARRARREARRGRADRDRRPRGRALGTRRPGR